MEEGQKSSQKGVNVSATVHEILTALATGQRPPRPDLPRIEASSSLAAYTRAVLRASTAVGTRQMEARPRRVWVHVEEGDMSEWMAAAGPMPIAFWMAAVLTHWALLHEETSSPESTV